METAEIFSNERRHMSGVYNKREIAIVSGKGVRVTDADGREYIDCVTGHGVANLGHSHPAIAEAIYRQAQQLVTCPGIFFNDRRAQLMKRLSGLLPSGIERMFLCNSGTEAVEGAIKFARLATKRPGIVATMRGFHGRTLGALSATWEKKYREPFLPLVPEFSHVPYDNIEAMTTAINDNTAAVIVEIVQGEGGVRPGSGDYFRQLRQLCDERGAMLIIDEVQTGFGRTGKWFACEHFGVTPDLICLGKGVAGGVPMGVIGIGDKVGELPTGVHGSTFGGNPLACAASLAALDVYESENLIDKSRESGEYLKSSIENLQSPKIREVRGLGLMIGIECKTRIMTILQNLTDRGVLALPTGTTVIRLLPPLIISREDIDQVVAALAASLEN